MLDSAIGSLAPSLRRDTFRILLRFSKFCFQFFLRIFAGMLYLRQCCCRLLTVDRLHLTLSHKQSDDRLRERQVQRYIFLELGIFIEMAELTVEIIAEEDVVDA